MVVRHLEMLWRRTYKINYREVLNEVRNNEAENHNDVWNEQHLFRSSKFTPVSDVCVYSLRNLFFSRRFCRERTSATCKHREPQGFSRVDINWKIYENISSLHDYITPCSPAWCNLKCCLTFMAHVPPQRALINIRNASENDEEIENFQETYVKCLLY